MKGYGGSILVCDLSRHEYWCLPSSEYAEKYLGGRGLAARLYWDQMVSDRAALDPTSVLIIVTGPLAGFSGLAGSRWQICGKSPASTPQSFNYSNFGGSWGAYLKFAGYDGLIIRGAAHELTYLFIHDGVCEFRDARHMKGIGTVQARESLKSELGKEVRVLAIGPAGENLVSFASLLADDDASGSGGFGAVMGSKKLKAIAVVGKSRPEAANPIKLRELTDFLRDIKKGGKPQQTPPIPRGMKARRRACFGCISGCERSLLETADGKRGKHLCNSGIFYEARAHSYYRQFNSVPFLANRICDNYGLDTNVIESMVLWLSRCYSANILSELDVGLPLSKIGSLEFINGLVRKVSLREGFGSTLANGIFEAARSIGKDAEKLLGDHFFLDGTVVGYCPRMYITNALIFALEPRQTFPQLAEVRRTVWKWLDWVNGVKSPRVSADDMRFIASHFWGGDDAGDFSTYTGKALAAKMIQDRHYVKESSTLCHFSWHISNFEFHRPGVIAEILSAITGNQYSEESVYQLGERIFNLQRAINVRERRSGREADTLPEFWYTIQLKESLMNPKLLAPGPNGEPVTRKGSVLDRRQFEFMKDEYYRLRGWDVLSGLQTESKLAELDLIDVARELKKLNLVR